MTVNQGVLCIKWMVGNREKLKIIVSRKLHDVVMWNFNDAKTAWHLGVRRTYDKINRNNYYWLHLGNYPGLYLFMWYLWRTNPYRKIEVLWKLMWVVFNLKELVLLGHFQNQQMNLCIFWLFRIITSNSLRYFRRETLLPRQKLKPNLEDGLNATDAHKKYIQT